MDADQLLDRLAQTVQPGTVLIKEGTEPDGMIILLSGRLAVYRGEHKVGVIDEPGAYVGEQGMIDDRPRTVTVRADTSARIVRLDRKQAAAFLRSPAAEAKVRRTVSARLAAVNDTLIENQDKLSAHREAMTELLKELRGLYIEMRDQGATPARLERMRGLINTYGAGRYVKGHVRA
ncbi:MAG: cyclic nucleotide-binding domain-containing protein [Myxococcales bacterium]|nr:cyclic nucleotide-binding domain-containing protein [Myxococcales bacterium]MCB9552548.1 cyclic nucleotide-binding domain-containing protein [Myxococcales bacterium]